MNSSQMRNAFAYIAIALLAVVILNLYSGATTRNLMFRSKYASVSDKIQVVVSAFSGIDTLTEDNTDQVISVLGGSSVTRLMVTDFEGRILYDSAQRAEGKLAVLAEITQALQGSDVFHCDYRSGTLISYAAMPVMTRSSVAGCVYVMECDTERGAVIANLERNILRVSGVLLGGIFICAILFSLIGSRRMRKILTSMRMVREGEYSHKIQLRGTDEYAKLATEFNKLTDRLQESEQAQRQFVSDASHELKTPLASIKLLSDSILQNEMDADTMREFVSDIGSESDRLTRMTQKLLTLSKSEDGTQGEHAVVDLRDLVSRAFRMLVPLADGNGVRLTAALERGCTVLSYEDDVYQIIFNLVENGIKYNRPEGEVHVTVSRREEDVTLTVRDTGVGIPEDSLSHIFERFYRVDKARSRQAGGAGLGLAIVHGMTERNFGTIEVQSKVGEGTKFTVTLPFFGTGEEAEERE